MKTIFKNVNIITVNNNFDVVLNGEVEITAETITYVGALRKNGNADKVIDAGGRVLMPMPINAIKEQNIIQNPLLVPEDKFAELIRTAKKEKHPLLVQASDTLEEVGQCDKEQGVTPIGLLESYGVFDIPAAVVSAVWADKDDAQILAANNISVITTPSQNLLTGSGIAPLYSFIKKGVNVCLGSEQDNLWLEMFLAGSLQAGVLNLPNCISYKEVIKMATINGAKALGLKEVGSIEAGKQADMVLLNIWEENIENLLRKTALSAEPCLVNLSIIKGKVAYCNKNGNMIQ